VYLFLVRIGEYRSNGFLLSNPLDSIEKLMKTMTDSLPCKNMTISDLISTEFHSISNRMDLHSDIRKDKTVSETKISYHRHTFEYFCFFSTQDGIIHIPYGSDLQGMLEKLIEVIQEEIRKELRENPTYRDSFLLLTRIECILSEEIIISITRSIAPNNRIDDTEEDRISDKFSDLRSEQSMMDREEILREIKLRIVSLISMLTMGLTEETTEILYPLM